VFHYKSFLLAAYVTWLVFLLVETTKTFFISLPRRHQRHVGVRGPHAALFHLPRQDVISPRRNRPVLDEVRAHEPVVDARAVPREIFDAPPVVVRLDVVRFAAVGDVAVLLQRRRLHPRRPRVIARLSNRPPVYAVHERFVYAREVEGAHARLSIAGLTLARGGDGFDVRLGRGRLLVAPLEAAGGGAGVCSRGVAVQVGGIWNTNFGNQVFT
jgi:hypothetical protein